MTDHDRFWASLEADADESGEDFLTDDEVDASIAAPGPPCCEGALFWCPTVEEVECGVHGGFSMCCEHPERHMRISRLATGPRGEPAMGLNPELPPGVTHDRELTRKMIAAWPDMSGWPEVSLLDLTLTNAIKADRQRIWELIESWHESYVRVADDGSLQPAGGSFKPLQPFFEELRAMVFPDE